MTKTKTLALASQMHRTFDCGTTDNGTAWMLCDCHGYYLERTATLEGKLGAWVRVVTLCDAEGCTAPMLWDNKCQAHL